MQPYTGKILWVDLTQGTWSEESIPDEVYRKYLGGHGLGAWLLYREIPAGTDPLGPGNILGFLPGLLTGTWGEANCGGTLAHAIKQC